MSYTVPRMFEGQTVVVVATGQSLTEEQVSMVRDLPTIAVNDAFRMAPWAAILYAADRQWWDANPDAAQFPGVKLCAMPGGPALHMRSSGTLGFDPNPARVRTGGNSGYQAVHVAIHTGAERILLLGFDMHGTHYFGPHTKSANGKRLKNPSPESFRNWAERFGALNHRGAEIVNCTPGSALECFPKMSLEEVMAWS